jgi:hypothetical protein
MIGDITAQDRAQSLRHAEQKLQASLLALEAYDLRHAGTSLTAAQQADRRLMVDVAAQICWEYVVQREMSGAISQREVRERYHVPAEVWNRMGASPRPE